MKSELLQARVDQDPYNPLFRYSLGQALYEEGQAAEAVPHLEYCVDTRDDWMMAHILLGKAQLEIAEKENARMHLEKALELAVEQKHEDPADEVRSLLAEL